MVLVDANVLLYAIDSKSRHHAPARSWLNSALRGDETVGFSWAVLIAFIRLATNPSVFAKPLSVDDACAQVELWLGAPAAVVAEPSARHPALLHGLLRETGTGGNLTGDAHLAALALESGAGVASFDRDFGRFAGIEHRLPG